MNTLELEDAKRDKEYLERDYKNLQEKVDKFHAESGVKIDEWHYHSIGEAIKMVLAGKHLTIREDLIRIKSNIEEALKENI